MQADIGAVRCVVMPVFGLLDPLYQAVYRICVEKMMTTFLLAKQSRAVSGLIHQTSSLCLIHPDLDLEDDRGGRCPS